MTWPPLLEPHLDPGLRDESPQALAQAAVEEQGPEEDELQLLQAEGRVLAALGWDADGAAMPLGAADGPGMPQFKEK